MAQFVLDDPNMGGALALLGVLSVILVVIGIVAALKPVYFRMALRNAFRRPSQTTMVVLGLMVGTAILSGALVTSDSLEYMIVQEVYEGQDRIDEMVTVVGDGTFDHSVYEALAADEGVAAVTDGISPMVLLTGTSINNVDEGQTEGEVALHGMDFSIDRAFGTFETLDGVEVDGTSLGEGEAIVNRELAEAARIDAGDTIMVFYVPPLQGNETWGAGDGSRPGGFGGGGDDIHYATLTVVHVVEDQGKAAWGGGKNVFVTLGTAQGMACSSPDCITAIKVSNEGGVVEGRDGSDDAAEELDRVLGGLADTAAGGSPVVFKVSKSKQEAVELAEDSSRGMKDFLVLASSFTIIAGTLLIINIFTMLAEERKRELGISRAIGMKRDSLVRSFTFEGVVYGLLAAGIGTFVGLLIGYALNYGMFTAFTEADMVGVPFYFKDSSLLIAFAVGTLITVATVALSSWKVSRLNIVRSIRGMEEPVLRTAGMRAVLQGGAVLAVGLFVTYLGFAPGGSIILKALGPNLLVLGVGMSLRRWLSREVSNTAIGLGLIAYSTWGLFNLEGNDMEGMFAIVVVGVMLVTGAVLTLISNSRPIARGVGRLLALTPRGKAVGTPAIAYPLNKGFRTGMTIAMFALVIFIVMIFSIFFSIFAPNIEDEKGGYDIMATSSVPISDIHNISFAGMPGEQPRVEYGTLEDRIGHVDSLATLTFWGNFLHNGEELVLHGPPLHTLHGVDEGFCSYVEYSLAKRSDDYASDREAWMALATDGDAAIVDSATATDTSVVEVGDTLTLPDSLTPGRVRNYTVIGIADESLFSGLFVNKAGLLADFPHVRGNNMFLMTVAEGEDQGDVALDLEADLSAVGMDVVVLEDTIREFTEVMDRIFSMFSLFMALGLVVGVASLAVLAVRSVIERKQEIGIMRAIGFRKSMVLGAFSTEMLFVTALGVMVGLGSGLVTGYGVWKTNMAEFDVDFAVPWDNIVVIVAVTLLAAVICTFLPAQRASRTNPAEAVRWME